MLSQAEKQALRIKLRRVGKTADSPTVAAAAADANHVTALEGQLESAALEHRQQVTALEERLADGNRQLADARANGQPQLQTHHDQQAGGEAHLEQQQQQRGREVHDEQRQLSDVQQQLSDVRRELEDARQQAEASRISEQRLRAHLARSESLHSPLASSPHLFDAQQGVHQSKKQQPGYSRGDSQQPELDQQLQLERDGRTDSRNLLPPRASAASAATEAVQDIGSDGSSSQLRSVRLDMSQLQASSRIAAAAAAASSAVAASASLVPAGPLADSLTIPDGAENRGGNNSGGNPQELLRKLLPWRLPPQGSGQSVDSASESDVVAREEGGGVSQRATDAITKQADAIATLSHMVAALADQKRKHLQAVDILQVTTA